MSQSIEVEAKNFANYAYLSLLAIGALVAFWGLIGMISAFAWVGIWWLGLPVVSIITGIIQIAIGGFGAFTALTVWKPKIVDAVNQGKYLDAYQVASNPVQIIIGFICGVVISGILLILTQQKLEPLARPPPPPPA
ncbi:MAG: hypothetical protein ACUVQ0_05220 [Thermoproteota archaeon]